MPVVDVHQHLWPEQLLSALSRRRERPRLRGRMLELETEGDFELDLEEHDLDRRLAVLDRDGVDVAVVSLQPTIDLEQAPELAAAYHEGIPELVDVSGGRLRALAAGEVRAGFVGASLSAAAFSAGAGPLLTGLERSGGFLFVHPGPPSRVPADAPAWWPAVVDYTAQMQAAYASWLARAPERPALRVVFAALAGGAPFQLERLEQRLGTRPGIPDGVYLDTASYGRRALELCLAAHGPGRLVYGSDTPVIDARPTLEALRGFGDAVADAVLAENASGLLA